MRPYQAQTILKMTTDDKNINDIDVLRANINNETSQIHWNELQRFFCRWLADICQ